MRLLFMGTPEFAAQALRSILEVGHEVLGVYSQPPRPAGRGHHLQKTPVHLLAEEKGLRVETPLSLKKTQAQEIFSSFNADVAVVAAYGLILPTPILEAPRYGCLNIHASLLPRWRGAAPIHRSLLAGDEKTGITIMQMDAGLDTGPMLLKGEIPILPTSTAASLHDQLSILGGELIVEALQKLAIGSLQPQVQPEEGVTYAHKLTREEGRLNFDYSADVLERQVRALTPWPGVFFDFQKERYKVLKARALPQGEIPKAIPATLLDRDMSFQCGEGIFQILTLQKAGKAPMEARDFMNGAGWPLGLNLLNESA